MIKAGAFVAVFLMSLASIALVSLGLRAGWHVPLSWRHIFSAAVVGFFGLQALKIVVSEAGHAWGRGHTLGFNQAVLESQIAGLQTQISASK